MLVGAGNTRRGLAHVALLTAVLTGCAEASDEAPSASTSASATADAAGGSEKAAESGGTIGTSGSACELPVTFDIAAKWKAKSIDAKSAGDGSDLADEIADALLHQGPVTAACEVDAKPAGHIGFLRVWTGKPGKDDARTVLEAFVKAEDNTSKPKYTTFRSGGLDGVEVEYLFTSKLLEETKKERALAVTTASGPVVLHLGGLDSEEHEDMLPAFELAKQTLRTA
ncbi:lipoprotein [Streptomyces sp. NPDC092369]|uniref:lipoprotein n=1 Tax=Streptomyces sp. NPDC092369 TaxID=3366015 RepID=UPI0037F8DF5C